LEPSDSSRAGHSLALENPLVVEGECSAVNSQVIAFGRQQTIRLWQLSTQSGH
jgi:hypothetical protein